MPLETHKVLHFLQYFSCSVKEVGKALEKVAIIVIEWGMQNAVTYDTFENGSGFVFKGTSATIQQTATRNKD